MDASTSLPVQAIAHDSLRQGLPNLREDALSKHPVEIMQQRGQELLPSSRAQMLRDLYGVAFPAKMQIEHQLLGKFQRLPGVPSSQLGLESLTGALDEFSFESYLGLSEYSELTEPDLHSQMEMRLGMDGTKPVARGIM